MKSGEATMPEPKRKRSRARRDKRFANKGMKVKSFGVCDNCAVPNLPHTLCKSCGFYKGVKILSTKGDRGAKRVEARKVVAAPEASPAASE